MIIEGYDIKIKRGTKNVRIVITPTGEITLSCPYGYPDFEIRKVIQSKLHWIKSKMENIPHLSTMEDGEVLYFMGKPYILKYIYPSNEKFLIKTNNEIIVNHPKDKVDDEVKVKILNTLLDEFKPVLIKTVRKYEQKTGLKALHYEFHFAKTNWGVCNFVKGKISYNIKLMFLPEEQMEYVVLHELCHFLVHDHSKAFKDKTELYMPGATRIDKEMKESQKYIPEIVFRIQGERRR